MGRPARVGIEHRPVVEFAPPVVVVRGSIKQRIARRHRGKMLVAPMLAESARKTPVILVGDQRELILTVADQHSDRRERSALACRMGI